MINGRPAWDERDTQAGVAGAGQRPEVLTDRRARLKTVDDCTAVQHHQTETQLRACKGGGGREGVQADEDGPLIRRRSKCEGGEERRASERNKAYVV